MSVESVSAEGFARESLTVLSALTETARDEVAAAAGLIADCVRSDGVIQAFGTGHSQAIVLELAGRAGGLVPTNRLSIADLVLYGGGRAPAPPTPAPGTARATRTRSRSGSTSPPRRPGRSAAPTTCPDCAPTRI